MDLYAALQEPVVLNPGQRASIPIGIVLEIPQGFEGQIRPRSGLAMKFGISLTNCIGTIDSDYRGEIMVLLINQGDEPYVVSPNDRVAQLLIAPIPKVTLVEISEITFDEFGRGTRGFGSTG